MTHATRLARKNARMEAETGRKPAGLKRITVDFPREDEAIGSAAYAFRIEAADAERVDLSIDDGLWRPCRPAVGYWWFDWEGCPAGRHQAVARAVRNGESELSAVRLFRVELPK